MKDVIVIGGSGAGCGAAIYSARAGMDTLLITFDFGGQLLLTDSVENYPGIIKLSGFEIATKLKEHVKSYEEIEISDGVKVNSVEKKGDHFVVQTDNGKEYESRAVIVATGKRPKKMENVKNAMNLESKGIHYCAICDGPIYKGKPMAVIGGGYAGIEEALYISGITDKVYLLEYGKELGGEEITRKQVMDKKNIEKLLGVKVTEVTGKDNVTGLKYEPSEGGKEEQIEVSAIFVNIGQLPNSEFLKIGKKTEYNELIVNEKNETDVPGLYGAGDVTNIPVHQLIISTAEGCKAALSANDYVRKIKNS